jgi:hypothetical protein
MDEITILKAAKLIRMRNDLRSVLEQEAADDWQGEIGFVSGISEAGCSGEGSAYITAEIARALMEDAIEGIENHLAQLGVQ